MFKPEYLDPLLTSYTQIGLFLTPTLNDKCNIISDAISPSPAVLDEAVSYCHENQTDLSEKEENEGEDFECEDIEGVPGKAINEEENEDESEDEIDWEDYCINPFVL